MHLLRKSESNKMTIMSIYVETMALTWTWLLTYCDIFIRHHSALIIIIRFAFRLNRCRVILLFVLSSQSSDLMSLISSMNGVMYDEHWTHVLLFFVRDFSIVFFYFYDLVSHCLWATAMNSKLNRLHIEYWMIVEANGTVTSNEYITYFK